MENDDQTAEPTPVVRPSLPSLPPRANPVPVSTDTWTGVELEPEYLHHTSVPADADFVPEFQLWTEPPRLLVLIGLLSFLSAWVIQFSQLWPSLRDGQPTETYIKIAESDWFLLGLGLGALSFCIGWLWWSTAAAFNARRLVPLTTSPLLPIGVFVIAPIVFVVSSGMSGDVRDYVFVGAWVVTALSYFIVVVSLRGTAIRISAAYVEFTRMLWIPVAWIAYRIAMGMLFAMYEGPGSGSVWLWVPLFACEVIFPLYLTVSTWRGFGSFSASCRRLNSRRLELDGTTIDLMNQAFRRHSAAQTMSDVR